MSSYAGYRPYTDQHTARSRLLKPFRAPEPPTGQVFTASNTGYAPGGVTYAPIPKPEQVGAGGYPLPTPNDPSRQQPTTTTGGDAGGGGGGGGSSPPYASDPVYQQIAALANKDVQAAEAGALDARRQALIQFGDPEWAKKLGLGSQYEEAAQANPFSTLKNLLRGHLANAVGIDQQLNRRNLSSSSTRTRQQQQEQTGYLGGINARTQETQGLLNQILANLLSARSNAEARKLAAAQEWYRTHAGDTPADDGTAPDYTNPYASTYSPDQAAFQHILDAAIARAGGRKPPVIYQGAEGRSPTGGV